MSAAIDNYNKLHQQLFSRTALLEGFAPLLLRLYLIPVFWMAGTHKIDLTTLMPFESTVDWFSGSLGLPLPTLMAFMAGWTEIIGAVFLAGGFAIRWITVPLMVTMLVAALTAHWDYGWQAIADAGAPFANERVMESTVKLEVARDLLKQHGNYDWLTGSGSVVILNNGIEFAATYFIMLFSLFFTGGGRYTSIDYWLRRRFMSAIS
ncbi:MAG: putative membrane protein YphA (DoxX/SURF4 family) [Oceanicoccus sp.]|jgi:uncharacterized membrane protein YphA (DoxX/SURF4 family)